MSGAPPHVMLLPGRVSTRPSLGSPSSFIRSAAPAGQGPPGDKGYSPLCNTQCQKSLNGAALPGAKKIYSTGPPSFIRSHHLKELKFRSLQTDLNSRNDCTCGLLRREFGGRAYSSWSLPRPGPRPRRYWRRRLVRPLVNTGDGGEATCSGSVALIAMLGLALLEAYYLPRQHSNNLIHDNEVASLWVMRASLQMLLWSWFICRTHFISRRSHLVLLIYGALAGHPPTSPPLR
ncbi:hypothetical protein E2C01_034820 [Portunus trituberculatus]|uniref:Uncharacterized protein n=1 Tax=Portunus trituberculatus TaxID=210409 RepID=A0A5B7F814_PORTR|nr:hypothetical protein [Portunus trituberculatus]